MWKTLIFLLYNATKFDIIHLTNKKDSPPLSLAAERWKSSQSYNHFRN